MSSLPFALSGQVIHGRRLAASFGMPTANINPIEDISGLEYGVYYSKIYIDNSCYCGITNLGIRPTVGAGNEANAETYIYGFDNDLYGRFIRVELLSFKRPELKFSSPEELKLKMRQDMEEGRMYHSAHNSF